MLGAGQRLDGLIDDVGHTLHRQTPLPARDLGVGALREHPAAGRDLNAVGIFQRFLGQTRAAQQQDDGRTAAPQNIGGFFDLVGGHQRSRHGRQFFAGDTAFVPRRVGRQNKRRDLARRNHGCLHGGGGVAANGLHIHRGTHPGGHAPRPALGIRRQRRIEGTVIRCVIANDIHDRRGSAAGIVQIRQAVCQAGTAMQQRRGGLAGHTGVTIGGAGHHALEQAEHAAHAGDAVERRDEMHLGRAGIGEAGIDTAVQQRVHQTFGAIHPWGLLIGVWRLGIAFGGTWPGAGRSDRISHETPIGFLFVNRTLPRGGGRLIASRRSRIGEPQ